MKRGHIYTFVFMVAITAVLVFALAAAYEAFKTPIQESKALQEQRAVLYALGLDAGLKDDEVAGVYQASISEGAIGGISETAGKKVLAYNEGGKPAAYAVPFEGAGLWGSLRGYLGVKADLSATTGLVFTYQNETPGLGGRIDEEAFKEKWRGLPLQSGVKLHYGVSDPNLPDAITGATQTSSAVMRTINNVLQEVLFPGEVK